MKKIEKINNFKWSEKGSHKILNEIKKLIFSKISKNNLNCFVRGGDIISSGPQVNGVHEPVLTNFIDFSCKNGFNDFFMDIGANIGLSSFQNGNGFKKVVCFEPNPLLVQILKVNIQLSIFSDTSVHICDYGLGEKNGEYQLWIPRHNWGGAFIRSKENHYSDDTLASKDGFNNIDKNNYLVQNVSIHSTYEELTRFFSEFLDQKLTNGVIKIDVEGMEEVVLKGLAEALPKGIKVVVVFENWSKDFDFSMVSDFFRAKGRGVSFEKITKKKYFFESWGRVAKGFGVLISNQEFFIEDINADNYADATGDIILIIN